MEYAPLISIFTKAIPFIPKQAVDPKLKFIYGDTKSYCLDKVRRVPGESLHVFFLDYLP